LRCLFGLFRGFLYAKFSLQLRQEEKVPARCETTSGEERGEQHDQDEYGQFHSVLLKAILGEEHGAPAIPFPTLSAKEGPTFNSICRALFSKDLILMPEEIVNSLAG
jgi:hypothetical protein